MEEETVLHALWGCSNVRLVWVKEFGGLNSKNLKLISSSNLFGLTASSTRGSKLFAMVCWSLWNRRNNCGNNEPVAPMEKIMSLAGQYLQDFQQKHSKHHAQKGPQKAVWKPLNAGTMKTNFDGAVFEAGV